jgi:hypothetical protein
MKVGQKLIFIIKHGERNEKQAGMWEGSCALPGTSDEKREGSTRATYGLPWLKTFKHDERQQLTDSETL